MQSYPECIWEVSTRYKSSAAESRMRSRQWELHHCSILYTVLLTYFVLKTSGCILFVYDRFEGSSGKEERGQNTVHQ